MALVQQYYFFKYRRYFNFRSYNKYFYPPTTTSGTLYYYCVITTHMYNTKQCFWCNYSLPCKWYTNIIRRLVFYLWRYRIPGTFTAHGTGGNGSYTYDWWQDGFSTGITTNTLTPVFCILIQPYTAM